MPLTPPVKSSDKHSELRRAALEYHEFPTPGKVAIHATKQLVNQHDLALAYSPGVAAPCEEIVKDPNNAFKYTSRGNLVAVITNGTAVLGLGDIGPLAAKPVMEGKGVLFKKFAGIDVFDIEINEKEDLDKLVDIIASLEPTFGGINLEDIKAPDCFYVERKLRDRMKIPVFHDDQHGTAIVVGAAIMNGLKVVDKKLTEVKLVTSGAGAAALACLNLLVKLGLPRENIYVTDLAGVVYEGRTELMDEDKAVFAQIAFDVTDSLALTVGARSFKSETAIDGFFGFGLGFNRARVPGSKASDGTEEPGDPANGGDGAYVEWGQGWSGNGEWRCASQEDYDDTPCKNVDKGIKENDEVYSVNLTWKVTDDQMLYATWSEGYRPGGINRNPFAGNFKSDFLTNWELGWKTQWMDNTVQVNGAVFFEEWKDFQVGFQGANGITQNVNGPTAEITGLEMNVLWVPTDNLTISAGGSYFDTEVIDDYCPGCQSPEDLNGDGDQGDYGESANWNDAGARMPMTAHFKGDLIARYVFPIGSFEGHVQGSIAYQGKRPLTLNARDRVLYSPDAAAQTFVDLAAGIAKDSYEVELFVKNVTDEDSTLYTTSQCAPAVCGQQNYGVIGRPRTVGLKFTQSF